MPALSCSPAKSWLDRCGPPAASDWRRRYLQKQSRTYHLAPILVYANLKVPTTVRATKEDDPNCAPHASARAKDWPQGESGCADRSEPQEQRYKGEAAKPLRGLSSMSEVAHAAEHHGHATLVGGVDHFLVTHAAAGLDHAGRARVHHDVEAVAEGEEGVARHGRALQGQAGVLRLDAGNARRIEAAHLARAHAHGHAALAEDDGVALDVLGHLPGEQQVFHFFQGGLFLGNHLHLGDRQLMVVGRL